MELEKLIKDSGFDTIGSFDASQLEARDEVRDMCAVDRCHHYDKNWSCPPACGSVEFYRKKFKRYSTGYLFQTIARMRDAFDYEGIETGSKEHKQRLMALQDNLKTVKDEIWILGAGTCPLCETCTYPDAPCLHPDRRLVSMEAAGLVVSDVCALANVPYYHGEKTIAFCSCALM